MCFSVAYGKGSQAERSIRMRKLTKPMLIAHEEGDIIYWIITSLTKPAKRSI